MMSWWQILLFPFTILYILITDFRNHLYNIGSKKSFQFDVPVISVGNLTVGGTGKTPHVEYLIRLLKTEYQLATLSRGYGRKTKGFRLASTQDSAQTIGDEPLQFYQKFGNEISVAVGEERALAIPSILLEKPETQIILLDDAYQHRSVKPHLNILLTDYNRLFYQDFPFPSGRLRESRKGAKRADIIIVSKCPKDLKQDEKEMIASKIRTYSLPKIPIYFSGIRYTDPIAVFDAEQSIVWDNRLSVVLISGIAQTQPLEKYLASQYNLALHLNFGDHYHYSIKEVEKIRQAFDSLNQPNKVLLMTEKDAVKFRDPNFEKILADRPCYYLPIEIFFQESEKDFQHNIFKIVNIFKISKD